MYAFLIILISSVLPSGRAFLRIQRIQTLIVSRRLSVTDYRRTFENFQLASVQPSQSDEYFEENIFRDLVKLLMDSFLAVMVINNILS